MNHLALRFRVGRGILCSMRVSILALVLFSVGFAVPPGNLGRQSLAHSSGAALEIGSPTLRVFGPKDYGADVQNWAIVQDLRGVIYVGNGDGVLEFDGAHWRLIRVANRTTVRSLAVDAAGRVFVGAQGEVGTLEPDTSGQMQYVSLMNRIPSEDRGFSDVWDSFATKEGVVFSTATRIIRMGPRVEVWKPKTSFHRMFQVGERFFLRERDLGLMELADGEWRLIPGGERFATEKLSAMLPWEAQGSILLCTRTQGLLTYDGATFRPFSTEADVALKQNMLYAAVRLVDGSLALGTLNGGLYFLDAQGRQRGHLGQAEGLLDSAVYTLAQDRQGGLWMGLGKGIARAEVGMPLTAFAKQSGLDGTVTSICRHGSTLLAGTSQGLFRLVTHPKGETRFLPLPGIKSQTWAFLDWGPSLLVANTLGVYELQGGAPKLIRPSSRSSHALCRSRLDPSRVFVALQDGLASMRWTKDRWVDEGRIPGVTEEIRSLFAMADGRLWACTNSQGVIRLTPPSGWQGGSSGSAPIIERFGTAHGLPDLSRNFVYDLGGKPLFGTHRGLYRFDEAMGSFIPDPRFARLFPEGPRWIFGLVDGIKEDSRGWIWMHTKDELRGVVETGAAVPGTDGFYHWDPKPLSALRGSWIPSIHVDADDVVWFGGDEGLFRFEPGISRDYLQPFKALVRKVVGPGEKVIFGIAGSGAVPGLDYADNALRFEFAAPSFDRLEANQYQVFLEGVDRNWSSWSHEAYRDYTNLREGRYRFRVRAKNLYGTVSEEGSCDFRILPPWYRHPAAIVLWGLVLAGSIAGAFRWRLSAMKRRNQELSLAINQATEGLETLNRRLYNLNDAKNRIIGLAAHDLRNPLSTILLHCELLQSDVLEPEVAESVEKIQTLGVNMKNLIQTLLDVHAIEAGQAE
ncbi:MAG: histidine kinase dimerization/phospho-acceptor domain-containing protein, partial [Holophaga sp.]|nr:histidine kinase dimerization/phospho-acceptor domain-containing protein [Holophaga sp.]